MILRQRTLGVYRVHLGRENSPASFACNFVPSISDTLATVALTATTLMSCQQR